NQAGKKKNPVVEEGLCQHQYKTKKRTPPMFVQDRMPDFRPGRMRARSNPSWQHCSRGRRPLPSARACDFSFDFANNLFRLGIPSVNHQPARTFWNPSAKENHNETQRGANPERAAPSEPDWQPARIKQHEGR